MINLDKYQAVYDIYGLTNNQIEMNTGLTKKNLMNTSVMKQQLVLKLLKTLRSYME